MTGEKPPMTAQEAYDATVAQFRTEQVDPVVVLDDHEFKLWGEAAARAQYVMAAAEWRHNVDERLTRLEELVAELRDKP
jgi:hypothetical protein